MMYDFINSYDLPRPIGTVEEYSNLGMGLLGHTLGEIRGTDFENQLQKVVFDNIGMTNTWHLIPDDKSNIATPYNGNRKAVSMWDMSDVTLGAGGVKSCLKDMMTYLEANMGYGDYDLYPSLQLTHENTQTHNYPITTGLAWVNIFKEADGTTLTWHNGGTAGTVTFIGFVKDLDLGVVLLFNTEVVDRTGENLLEVNKAIEIIDAIKKY